MNDFIDYLYRFPCQNCFYYTRDDRYGCRSKTDKEMMEQRAVELLVYGNDCFEDKKEIEKWLK